MITNAQIIRNILLEREAYMRRLLDPRRDIDAECGHPRTITVQDYTDLYARGDIAQRVVRLMPDETWSQPPEIYETEDETETEFEKAWEDLDDELHLIADMQRADVLSGVGRFGIVLLGFDDGKPLNEIIEGIDENGNTTGEPAFQLLYIRPLEESLVKINRIQGDIKSPRYGLPLEYGLQFADSTIGETGTVNQTVHWSRVIHLADNRMNSNVFGRPRLEVVFNRILDLRKIAGGSGEMFWKGGFPGLSMESLPSIGEEVEIDEKKLKAQIEDYQNGLQRYLATVGMTVKSLSPQVADPGPHIEAQMRLIATAMAVPWRVFIGSEAAQLASEQDSQTWNRRLTRRREDYVSPFILRPLLDRLIMLGALPKPSEVNAKGKAKYVIEWPDLNTPSDTEKADVAQKKTTAIKDYVTSGADVLVPPFHFLTTVVGFSKEETDSILQDAQDQQALLADTAATSAADNAPPPTAAETAMQKAQIDAMKQRNGEAGKKPAPFKR